MAISRKSAVLKPKAAVKNPYPTPLPEKLPKLHPLPPADPQTSSPPKRRTAIVATSHFLKKKEPADTFRIAELMVTDKEDLIHKAAGGWIREAGKQAPKLLIAFLDDYAAVLTGTFLRYAIEKLPAKRENII